MTQDHHKWVFMKQKTQANKYVCQKQSHTQKTGNKRPFNRRIDKCNSNSVNTPKEMR